MRRSIFVILIALLLAVGSPPLAVNACKGGGLMNIAIKEPCEVTIYSPIKGKCAGAKVEKVRYSKGRIILKNGKRYRLKTQFRNILVDNINVYVYRRHNRIYKLYYAERGYNDRR